MSSFTEGLNLRQGSSWQRKSADYSKRFKIKMDVAATDFCIGTANIPINRGRDPFDKDGWKHADLLMRFGDLLEITSDVLVLKVNQIGTDVEAIEAVKLAKNANWGIVTIFEADLAVGLSTS
ncbi:hypothetical protein MKX03_005375 [Papaver bracteatum]|nr:hypothetical protein MKX03_005375 [Papaver bracteatum]